MKIQDLITNTKHGFGYKYNLYLLYYCDSWKKLKLHFVGDTGL